MKLPRSVLGLAGLACTAAASAAEISAVPLDDDVTALLVLGDIAPGDGKKFRSEASKHDDAIVLLESDGGALPDALEIGKAIRLKGYATAVVNGSSCNSACALVWLAGTPRALSKSGRIGFHAAYSASSGVSRESGVANALVGRYLTLLNLSERALIFATTAPPDRLRWLTTANYESAGMDLKVIDDLRLGNSEQYSRATPKGGGTGASPWRNVGSWAVRVDETLQNSCFVIAQFTRETIFRVGFNVSEGYYLLLANPKWQSLRPGAEYELQLQFDDETPWDAPTTAVEIRGTTALLAKFSDSRFWTEFALAKSLRVSRRGKHVSTLSLTGTRAAFNELIRCQKAQTVAKRSGDPFAK